MSNNTPEALRLARMIEHYNAGVGSQRIVEDYQQAAGELRRLYFENEKLRAALAEQPGYKLVPEVPTNEWINNLARRQTGSFEKAPFAEIHQCIAELLESAPEAPQPAKQPQFGPSSEGRPMYWSTDEVIEFARAIERAHGIGEHE